jgi:Uma2 family endonuclease
MLVAMTSLLELPVVREQVHRMSVEDYHKAGQTGLLSKNLELLRGIIVTKMSKSPLHEFVVQRLIDALLATVPAAFKVRKEGPLTLRDSEPEPDISVVRGRAEDWIDRHPSSAQLVIEVAIRSLPLDKSKAEIYAEAGVPEYWLVLPEERTVEVYRQPSGERYLSQQTLTERDILRCAAIAQVSIAVRDILPG